MPMSILEQSAVIFGISIRSKDNNFVGNVFLIESIQCGCITSISSTVGAVCTGAVQPIFFISASTKI